MKPDPTQTSNFYKTDHIECQYVKCEVCNMQRQLKVKEIIFSRMISQKSLNTDAIKTSLCLFEHHDKPDTVTLVVHGLSSG